MWNSWVGVGPVACTPDDSLLDCILLRLFLVFFNVAEDEPGL